MSENKNGKGLWIFVSLGVAALVFIFSNSFKNGEQSHSDSMFFVGFIEPFFDKLFGDSEIDANFVVRKCAHVFEFGCLGALSALISLTLKKRTGNSTYFYFIAGCLAAAAVDEFIQSFTGRTSSVSDVLLDFFGALLGFGLVYSVSWLKNRRNKKQ